MRRPLRGEAFKLEIRYKNRGDAHELPLGHVELNSDELLARCLCDDSKYMLSYWRCSFDGNSVAAAVYNVIGEQSAPAEMKIDFLLVPDDEVATDTPTDAYDLSDLAAGACSNVPLPMRIHTRLECRD